MKTQDLAVCEDCILYIANGDLPEDDVREKRVVESVKKYDKPGQCLGYDGDYLGFQPNKCECCGGLPGERYKAVLLIYRRMHS